MLDASPPLTPLVLGALAGAGLLVATALDAPTPLMLDVLDTGPSVQEARRAAKDEARADLAAGRPRWMISGYPSVARDDFGELLEERFGIALEEVGGCAVTDDMDVRLRAYDSVIVHWLEARHGPDVLERTWDDAEARHAARADERARLRLRELAAIEAMLADESLGEMLDELERDPAE